MRNWIIRRTYLLTSVILLSLLASGCSWITGGQNYNLSSGNTVSGSLFAPSANVTLEQGTQVTGSVIILCCNLIANGEIDGNITMISGNVTLGPNAVLRGKVRQLSGNFRDESGAYQGGTTADALDVLPALGVLAVFFALVILLFVLFLILLINWARQRLNRSAPQHPE